MAEKTMPKVAELTITGEQAFDMLPAMCRIFEKLDLTKIVMQVRQENKDNNIKKATKTTINDSTNKVLKYVSKNIPKIKSEFFEIVGIAWNVSAEEAKKAGIGACMKVFFVILKDPDMTDFFGQAIQ
jgi:hypothetical protein